MKTWKQAVHILFLLCGLLLLFAPCAKAQLTDDGKVDVVQAHFHFTNPDGSPISHGVLTTVLKTPMPPASQPGNGYTVTYLDAGLVLSNYMDQKQKFDSGNYSEYTIDYDRLLVEDLSAWLGLFGIQTWLSATDVYDFIASHGSTFKSQLTQNLEDSSLDIFNAVGEQYVATQAVTETYGELGSDIYGKFGTATDGIYALYDTLEAFRQATVNNMLAVYMRNCFGTDDESDANAWLVAEVEAGNSLVRDDLDRIHLDCRYAYTLKQKLAVIQPDLDQYTSDVRALLVGGVKIVYTPDAYALHAPVQVIMDASGSTGTFGSSIASYQWTVDGSPVSTSPNYTGAYFAVGQHTVQCTVTDSTGAQITGKDTINVGPPPIQVTNFDADHLKATFTTPANSLVNNPNGCTWNFGDGSAPVVSSTNTPVFHTFPSGQVYRVTLTEATFVDTTVTGTTSVNFTPNPTDVYSYTLANSEDWGISGSPYRIHGAVTIPAGVRLTLEPGVVLQFASGYYSPSGIDIYGGLVSKGQPSPKQRVYLTSYRDNSPPSLPSPGTDAGQSGDWQGLTFFPGSSGTLTSCVVREATNGAAGDVPVIAGAIFDRSSVYTSSSTSLTVSGNVFTGSQLGVYGNGGPNGDQPRDVSITGNSFSVGGSFAAGFGGNFGQLAMSGNTSGDGSLVHFYLGYIQDGLNQFTGLTLSKSNTWNPQPGVHLLDMVMTVAAGATLNLGAGLTMQCIGFNGSQALTVQGSLSGPASGSPALLTSGADNSPYGGDDKAGNADWAGVVYGTGLTANLSGVVIRHASPGISGLPAAITNATFDQCGQALGVDYTYYGIPRTTPLTLSGNTFLSSSVYTDSSTALTVSGNVFLRSQLSVYGNDNGQPRDVSVTGNSFSVGGSFAAGFGGNFGQLAMSGNTSGDGSPVLFYLGYLEGPPYGFATLTLSKSNTWNPQPGVHLLDMLMTVAAGATLNLGAGLTMQCIGFNGSQALTVQGSLSGPASGSPALLTSGADNSPYGGTDNARYPDWAGVVYGTGLTANLSGVVIRHASPGISGLPAAITNATFDQCGQALGVDYTYYGIPRTTPLTLSGNTFLSSSVYTDSSTALTASGNVFIGSQFNVNNSGTGSRDVSVTGNSFSEGGRIAACFGGNLGQLAMSGNTSGDGSPAPFSLGYIQDGLNQFTGLSLSKSNTWNLEPSVHLMAEGLTISAGATLNLGVGLTVQCSGYNGSPALTVQGSLGGPASGSPALLTSRADNSPYGGTDNANNADWPGVVYGTGLTANLSGVTIKHASVGVAADTANLNNCTFTQNSTGVLVNNGGGTYRDCSFTQNGMAVQNNSTTVVDARGNFWGDPTGPYNAKSNPGGLGNPVSDYVLVGTLSPPVLTSLTFLSSVPGGTVLTATVTLSNPALADTVVGLSSSDPITVRVFRSVLVPAGSTSATFAINTFRSHTTKTVTLRASLDQVVQTNDLTITGR